MIKTIVGNIFEQKHLDILLHVCNLQHTFGSGIAAIIKQKYPEAYDADLATVKGDPSKLGTFSFAKCANGKTVINIYAMPDFGQFSYDAFYKALLSVKQKIKDPARVLGMPYAIGADRAGGEFSVIYSIVEAVFFDLPNEVFFCRLPQFPENLILKSKNPDI